MIFKEPDNRDKDIQALETLLARNNISADTRKRIEQEIRNIRSGVKAEAEAAYEMKFHFGNSKNCIVLHDLRLETARGVAQIDHLIVNRVLDIYVCESKNFSEGIAINEHGEFSAFYNGKASGIPSPIEQNARHILVLEELFKSGRVKLPSRLGIPLKPRIESLILVSTRARITRPKIKLEGVDSIIKNDQLRTRIWKDIDEDNNFLKLAKVISQETLLDLAKQLVAAHKPASFDWAARFGISSVATLSADKSIQAESNSSARLSPKQATCCASCHTPVSLAVIKFCRMNATKFAGKVYCISCQPKFQT